MPQMYAMTHVAPTVSALLGLPAPAQAQGLPIPEITADLVNVERVAILAPDAFGWFAWTLWQEEMPFLQGLHKRHSLKLRSVMPSITPVNFAAMVSGTDLAGHGVRTYEHDFTCETLFDVVRRAGGSSAAVGFENYTGSKLLVRYADIDGTVARGSDDHIVDQVCALAQASAPTFIIAQLGRVDDTFHRFGPSSPEVVPMVRETDARLERAVSCLKPQGYGVLILADHGQHDIVDEPETALKGGHGQDRPEDREVPLTWV